VSEGTSNSFSSPSPSSHHPHNSDILEGTVCGVYRYVNVCEVGIGEQQKRYCGK